MNIIGKGNTADIIEYEDNKVCKLFVNGYPQDAIAREIHNASVMKMYPLPVPACYGSVELEQRVGILYDRVYGSTLLEELFTTNDVDDVVTNLVLLHKKILGCHTNEVMSYKDFLSNCIAGKSVDSEEIVREISELPNGNYLCHGDYHPGNVMVNKDGTLTIIDFMNVCSGPWEYDVARTYYLIAFGDVPKDAPNYDDILKMQKQLADYYLSKMNVNYHEISNYIDIIHKVRSYE